MKRGKMILGFGMALLLYSSIGYATNKKSSLGNTQVETQLSQPTKGINVRVNPLGLLLGAISADVDFKIGDKFTIGPSMSYYSASIFNTKLTGAGIGARGNYYVTGDAMTDSFILGPQLGMSLFSVSSGTSKATATGFYVGAIGGYQWVWENGFNVNLGLGANYYSQAASALANDGTTLSVPGFHGFGPTGELTIGWLF